MYWLRSSNPFALIPLVILFSLWWAGGWLIAAHIFKLRPRERLVSGLGIGLLLYIVLSNLLANLLPIAIASWCASLLILGTGFLVVWRSPNKSWFSKIDLNSWPQLLCLAGITVLFTLINRGLAIFDEFYNLPVISMMAAGDVPPHFFLNPGQPLEYHYGLLLLAANLVKFGNFFIWSAFDLSRGFIIALTLTLAWLWFARFTKRRLAIFLGVVLILFGMGARWLLLFLPLGWLSQLSSMVQLFGSGAASGSNLQEALVHAWKIEGGGPIPFPFAFVNGIFYPLNFAMGGSGSLSSMTLVLLILLGRKQWPLLAGLIFGVLLSSLALSAEYIFLPVWAGIFLAVLLGSWVRHDWHKLKSWLWILPPALILALLGGGVITNMFIGMIANAFSRDSGTGWLAGYASTSTQGIGLSSFSLRWPPAFFSAHLGALSLTQPLQLLAALAEMGLVIFLAPAVTIRTIHQLRRGNWVYAGIGLAALAAFILPIFISFSGERDITRVTGAALFIWLLLGYPLAWQISLKANLLQRTLITAAYTITILGGVALFAVQIIAIAQPQLSYFIKSPDAAISSLFWDRLQSGAQIMDTVPYRAVTLFGRAGGKAYLDIFEPFPEYSALEEKRDPVAYANAGYSYFYMDKDTWQSFNPDQKKAFQQPCVKHLAEETSSDKDFRWLLDIRACSTG